MGPWARFIRCVLELDRRRAGGLGPEPSRLTWLEVEGLLVLAEERAKYLKERMRG